MGTPSKIAEDALRSFKKAQHNASKFSKELFNLASLDKSVTTSSKLVIAESLFNIQVALNTLETIDNENLGAKKHKSNGAKVEQAYKDIEHSLDSIQQNYNDLTLRHNVSPRDEFFKLLTKSLESLCESQKGISNVLSLRVIDKAIPGLRDALSKAPQVYASSNQHHVSRGKATAAVTVAAEHKVIATARENLSKNGISDNNTKPRSEGSIPRVDQIAVAETAWSRRVGGASNLTHGARLSLPETFRSGTSPIFSR